MIGQSDSESAHGGRSDSDSERMRERVSERVSEGVSESDRVGAWLFGKQLLFVLLLQCREHLHRIKQAECESQHEWE